MRKIPLFRENIEAWKYGPVVSEVYEKYRYTIAKEIISFLPQIAEPDIDTHDKQVIKIVYGVFKKKTGKDLVRSTHSETPWLKTYYDETKGVVISNDLIKSFFG